MGVLVGEAALIFDVIIAIVELWCVRLFLK
jgi:hypothetical protein